MDFARERRNFYDDLFQYQEYASSLFAESAYPGLREFVSRFNLEDARVLDVGCGRGWYASIIPGWIGLDISYVAGQENSDRFVCGTAEAIPLRDKSVDAIWSISFLEHSRDPERSLTEMTRVLKDGGALYLAPAWRVSPWRPKGYEVKDFADLNLPERIMKRLLPLLDWIWQRGFFWVPLRLCRELVWASRNVSTNLLYISFEPNFDEYLVADSDACSSMDNHEVLLWLLAHGFVETRRTSWFKRVGMRCGPLVLTKRK